jgi:hypothetical protein
MVHTHRLVAEAFCDPVDGCNVVNHLDGSRDNNVWTNLEWTTFKGNTQHAVRTGLMVAARGESSGGSTLTGGQVDEIRRRIILGENGTALGKEFGVKPMCISDIKNGKTWAKHGDPELVRRCKETDQFVAKGSSHAKSKITEKDVERIIVMLKARVLQKDIAREIGCHEMTVCRINLGKVWVHVRVDGCGEPPYFILKPRAHHLAALSISL